MAQSMTGYPLEAEREDPELIGEPALVAGARRGDLRAFERLVDRYRLRAVRLAAAILHSREDAEDAAQEAFVRAFRSISSFRGDGRFYTWLYHIVLSVCLNRLKTERRRKALSQEAGRPACSTSGPEEDVALRMLIGSLLSEMTPAMRGALVLREVEGLEYEEISRALGIPAGTVRSRLNAARERFRTLYDKAAREASNV